MAKKVKLVLLIYFAVTVAVIVADQLTKMKLYGQSFSVIGDFLWVESSFNTGAAFSFMSGAVWFFIVVSALSSGVMIYLLISNKWGLSIFNKVAISLILGGAIGNLIDRIMLGGVRDFIYLKSINFAIFNVADMAVTIGGILLVIGLIIEIVKSCNKREKAK